MGSPIREIPHNVLSDPEKLKQRHLELTIGKGWISLDDVARELGASVEGVSNIALNEVSEDVLHNGNEVSMGKTLYSPEVVAEIKKVLQNRKQNQPE